MCMCMCMCGCMCVCMKMCLYQTACLNVRVRPCALCAALCRTWCVRRRHRHHGLLQVQGWVHWRCLLPVRTPVLSAGHGMHLHARCPGLLQRRCEEWARGRGGLRRKLWHSLHCEGACDAWRRRPMAHHHRGSGCQRGAGSCGADGLVLLAAVVWRLGQEASKRHVGRARCRLAAVLAYVAD